MEHVFAPADIRQLLMSIVRANVPPPYLRPGYVATCDEITVARRAISGELFLRCYRSAHGAAPQYAELQAALCKLTGPPPPCDTCDGTGWLAMDHQEAREAALRSLAFGSFRGIGFEALSSADDLLKKSTGLIDLLNGGVCAQAELRNAQSASDASIRDDLSSRLG